MTQDSKLEWELGLFAPSVSQLTPEATLSLMKDCGYRWVEWRVQTQQALDASPWGKAYNTLVLDHLEQDARNVRAALAPAGARVSAMQVDAPDDRPETIATVRHAAETLGCSRVLLASPGYDAGAPYRTQQHAFAERIRKWVDGLRGTGVRLCIENHMWTITPSCALVMDILRAFPFSEVGVMWDPANSWFEGSEVPAMALNLLGPYLAEVHLKNGAWAVKDGKWAFDWCDLGQGMVDWPDVLKRLNALGYAGPLVVEDYRPFEPGDKLARAVAGYQQAVAAAHAALAAAQA